MEYRNLIIKFLAGEISDNELVLLKSWLELDPENRRVFNIENELWQEASFQKKFGQYKNDTEWMKLSDRLGLSKNERRSVTVLRKNNFRILLAAAVIVFIVAIGELSFWKAQNNSFKRIKSASNSVSTNEGEKAHIFLSDSTEIILNSGSSIEYNADYNLKDRIVKLKGEAFFHVTTNHNKPFVVQLDQMSISATGTRFNVCSFSNEDRIETTLVEGIIQVLINGKQPINVETGQQVVYFMNSNRVLVNNVVTETYTSWKENKLRFQDTPFEEVLKEISRKYNVTFVITSKDLLNLKYTATFIDESIDEVMLMLKAVSPITYKIYDRTAINDKYFIKTKIVVGKRKTMN